MDGWVDNTVEVCSGDSMVLVEYGGSPGGEVE